MAGEGGDVQSARGGGGDTPAGRTDRSGMPRHPPPPPSHKGPTPSPGEGLDPPQEDASEHEASPVPPPRPPPVPRARSLDSEPLEHGIAAPEEEDSSANHDLLEDRWSDCEPPNDEACPPGGGRVQWTGRALGRGALEKYRQDPASRGVLDALVVRPTPQT